MFYNNQNTYNTFGNNAVSIGSQLDANVAARVKQQAEALQQNMYTDLQSTVKSFPEHNLDVNYALNNGQRNFDNFMQQNATREVLDFTPTKKDLVVMQPRSLFNPNRGISNVQAEDLIRNRLSNVNLEVFNDNLSGLGNPELGINHFLRKDKKPFIRTIQNTYESPDIKFINDGKEYYIRKYKNADTGNTFEDLFIIKDGKAFNKLPSNEDHILNKIKGAQDLSLAPVSRVMTATDATLNINNIPLQSVVVNRNLPHVSGLYEGLTPEQSRLLNEAFIKAKYYNPYGFTNILPDVNYALNNGQRNFDNFMQQNATREVLDFGNPNWYGRQDLIESLKTGNYTDISFGSLPENIRQQVNQIRINNAEIPLEPEMIIPAGVVKKWSGNRLVENYSPERIAQIADEIFHSPDVNVYDGSYKHIQKLVKERPEHTNDFYGFISRDKTTGQTTAKTIYERGRSLAGRQPASLQNESSAGRMRLSDLQTPSNNKLSFDEVVVNRNLPHVSGLYEGLTLEQSRLLNEAFIKAKYYNPYGFTNILPDVNYALNNGQRTRILQNMSVDDIKNRLLQIKQERFRNITPQTGLTPEEYANIVQQQADNLGVKIAEGNPDKINSGVMHFVLDDNGKISYRAPFVGTLKDTYINPDITFSKGVDKNYVRAIRDIGRNKNYLDNLITRNGNFYTKYPTSITNIAKKIGDPHNDLSVSGDFLSDMGISPSGGSNNNIALQKGIVNGQPLDVDGKKLGTLGSLAAVQEALLQQATMSQNPQIKRDLLTAEKRLNKMLPTDYTQKRQSLDKAKSLKNSYELGLNFNPEYMDYDALNLTSARDKHAFLQGRVNRILLNSSNNPELLAMVQQDIETTRKIARKQLFENNMEYIRKNQFLQNQLDKLLAEIEQNKRRSVLFKQRKIRTADKYLNDNYGAITAAGLNNGLNNAASAGARQYLIEKNAE